MAQTRRRAAFAGASFFEALDKKISAPSAGLVPCLVSNSGFGVGLPRPLRSGIVEMAPGDPVLHRCPGISYARS
jgi:hypothetical protein